MFKQKLKSAAFRTYRKLQYRALTKNSAALRVLCDYPRLALSAFEASTGGGIQVRNSDVDPTLESNRFLLRGSDCVERLLNQAEARFSQAQDGVLLETNGVRLKLQDWEELFIASEVFAEGIYNLKRNHSFVLLDVGMNVGTTSLFFARQPACEQVYSFELFPQTAAKARENLSLNPSLAPKINVSVKGLAARAYKADLDYVPEYKGSVGMHGLPAYVSGEGLKHERVEVEFLDCAQVVQTISSAHPHTDLVCKLDCEGAEYEILTALSAQGLISRFSAFLVEWHVKGAAPIEQILLSHGFEVLSFAPAAPTHSMLYAWGRDPAKQ
jgi:FkbM family methyltransferase